MLKEIMEQLKDEKAQQEFVRIYMDHAQSGTSEKLAEILATGLLGKFSRRLARLTQSAAAAMTAAKGGGDEEFLGFFRKSVEFVLIRGYLVGFQHARELSKAAKTSRERSTSEGQK